MIGTACPVFLDAGNARKRHPRAKRLVASAAPSPKLPLNVRARPKPSVGKLANDLAAGVEMEHVDALPAEPVTDEPAYDEFLKCPRPLRFYLRSPIAPGLNSL